MDIPIEAPVFCQNERCGRAICVIVNPVTDKITHFVVRQDMAGQSEYLVPISEILESTPYHIKLNCTAQELSHMPPFIQTRFLAVDEADYLPRLLQAEKTMLWPYDVTDEPYGHYAELEQIPAEELAVHRGNYVMARDGAAGHVDRFLVNPDTNHITHLVIRTQDRDGLRDLVVPLSAIDNLENDVVRLKLDKKALEQAAEMPHKVGQAEEKTR